MMRFWTLGAAAIAVVSLSACEQLHEKFERDRFDEWSLVAAGEVVGGPRFSGDQLNKIASELLEFDVGTDEGRAKAKGILAEFDKSTVTRKDVPAALTGVAGQSALSLVRWAVGEPQIISGKIRDYIYDDGEKSGHLAVDTRVETFSSLANLSGGSPFRVEFFHWDIEVIDIYEVIPRGPDPFDPFPKTVQFPPEALGPNGNIRRRGLDHKLFARGKGIVVRHVYRTIGNGPIERLPDDHPFYETTEDSCIDLLFKGYPPASELPRQEFYCLGRCEDPQVVNTK